MQKAPFANCDACPLKLKPMVPGEIRPDAKYTIVGESPGYEEVKSGHPFVGPSGRLLWEVLDVPRDQCNVTNAVLCQPSFGEEKEEVLAAAATCCRPRLLHELDNSTAPILLLGTTARDALFPPHEGEYNTMLNRWGLDLRGRDVIATLHPAYVLREPDSASLFFECLDKFAHGRKHTPVKAQYEVVTSIQRLGEVLSLAGQSGSVVFDLETDQIDKEYNRILLMALCFDCEPDKAYIIPCRHPGAPINLLEGNTKMFNALLWNTGATKIGHNGKFDAVFLNLQYGHHAYTDFDTMVAHYCLDENSGHGLKELGARYLDTPDWEIGLRNHLKSRNDFYSKIPWGVLCPYAAMDVVATMALYPILREQLKEENLTDAFRLKMDEVALFTDVECVGFMLDVPYLYESQERLEGELKELKKELYRLSDGVVINPNSSQQVSHFVYDVLKIPQPKGRKIKPRSVNKDVIELLKDVHPFIPVLKKQRKIGKMKSSYVDNLLEAVNEDDILRADAKVIGTVTQRISIEKPATQTMPRVGDSKNPLSAYTSIIRGSFIPRPGMLLWQDDYSQAELRIAAALSGDEFLLSVFRDGRDLHSEVAIAMYGPDFTKEQRMLTKMFNFSYLYGGNEHSFAEDAGLPISVAIDFVRKYNQVMPRLVEWKAEQEALMMKNGYVRYRTGAMRRFPLITSANKDDARKAAYNSPVQGPSSLMCTQSAWRSLAKVEQLGGHVLLLVHDSIIGEAPVGTVEQTAVYVKHIMETTASEYFPEVKWVADAEIGERWSQLHKLSS